VGGDRREQRGLSDMRNVSWVHRLKPASSAKTRVLTAALMWTIVGTALALFGTRWVLAESLPWTAVLLAAAVGVGVLKAIYVLERSARRAVVRIRQRGDDRCIGGFFSPKAWLFVVAMATLGRFLRGGLLPRSVVGLLYVAVGTALLMACRRLWSAWLHFEAAA